MLFDLTPEASYSTPPEVIAERSSRLVASVRIAGIDEAALSFVLRQ